MATLSSLALFLSWIAPSNEPFTFLYFSTQPKPAWCDHPSKCGDWPQVRILVAGWKYDLSNVDPGTYYVAATTTYNKKTESEFSQQFVLTIGDAK